MKKLTILIVFISLLSCNTKTYEIAKIKTSMGDIYFKFYNETPNHKASFIKLAKEGLWDDSDFNRIVKDFVIQGGCPDTPEGFSNSPYLLKPEFNKNITHTYGAVGAGRDDNPNKLSAGCQFYIVQNKKGTHFLDGNYTVFGQVIKGMDVVDRIASLKTDSTEHPLQKIIIDIDIIKVSDKYLKRMALSQEMK